MALRFSLSRLSNFPSSYKALILGGGTAGLPMSHRLARHYQIQNLVGLVEPNESHYYQPLWSLVGAGKKDISGSVKPLSSLLSSQVNWHKSAVKEFKPEQNAVVLTDGSVLEYETLIVALGIDMKFNLVKGLEEAFQAKAPGVCTNYSFDIAEKTWADLQNIAERAKNLDSTSSEKLTAIFTQPNTPIKCAGAPQKIAYLAEEYFRSQGVREKIDMKFYTGMPGIFGQPDYAVVMRGLMEAKNINVVYENNLDEINHQENSATFRKSGSEKYDFLHVTPPQGPLPVIKNSPISDPVGWVDVDKNTMQHNKFKNIWSLGDCSSLPTSKTAAAIASQNAILIENVKMSIGASGHKKNFLEYDGYASCPLVIGDDKGMLAEFDYTMKRLETFPVDQRKPAGWMYKLKADIFPKVYWSLFVSGKWAGPKIFRKIFHPFG